ncbi:MAG: hypothetical protein HKL90_13745 [Elusimicrobia bacterium]|nr:hypothetical protein [Elusimicrobiota bacterium]
MERRRLWSLLILLFAVGARAQAPVDAARDALTRLQAACTPLTQGPYRPQARRPVAGLLETLSATADQLRQEEIRRASPERAKALESFAADARRDAERERRFWSQPAAAGPQLPAATAQPLLKDILALMMDFDELAPKDTGGGTTALPGARGPRQPPAATLAAQERGFAAAALARANPSAAYDGAAPSAAEPAKPPVTKDTLRVTDDEHGHAHIVDRVPANTYRRGQAYTSYSSPQPLSDLRTRPVPAPAAAATSLKSVANCRQALSDSPRLFGHGFDDVCRVPGAGVIAAPMIAGVYDAVATAGKAVADHFWSIMGFFLLTLAPKILAMAGELLLAATGVGALAGAAAFAATIVQILNGIMAAVGVVLAGAQLVKLKAAAMKLWSSARDTVQFYAALRALTKSTLIFAASALLAAMGVRGLAAARPAAAAAESSTSATLSAAETLQRSAKSRAMFSDATVLRNAAIDGREARIAAAMKQLRVDRPFAEKIADAHDKVPCTVGRCTAAQLRAKVAIMGGKSPKAAAAIRSGLAGDPPTDAQAETLEAAAQNSSAYADVNGRFLSQPGGNPAAAARAPEPVAVEKNALTKHGAERIRGQGETRAGTLSFEEVLAARKNGDIYVSAKNNTIAHVFKFNNEAGKVRFNVVVDGDHDRLVTTYYHLRSDDFNRQLRKWEWRPR